MTRRVIRVTGAGSLIAGAALALLLVGTHRSTGQQTTPADTSAFVAPVDVDTAGLPGPRQPIFFRHDIHAGQYQLDCRYCHSYVEVSPSPGLPSTAACLGCHRFVGTGNPEVEKLRQVDAAKTPIEWTEVHVLPQFVHFPHMRHVGVAKLDCTQCHGQVNRMPQVYQYSSLKMGWCVSCHVKSEYRDRPGVPVTTECSACHY